MRGVWSSLAFAGMNRLNSHKLLRRLPVSGTLPVSFIKSAVMDFAEDSPLPQPQQRCVAAETLNFS